MVKFKVGDKVRIGGKYGPVETITAINGDTIRVESPGCVGWITKGDCSIVLVKEVRYEQLRLF